MHYLMMVNARDCVKDKVTGCYLINTIKKGTQFQKQKQKLEKQKEKKMKLDKNSTVKQPSMIKVERRAKYNEHKRRVKEVWIAKVESEFESQD